MKSTKFWLSLIAALLAVAAACAVLIPLLIPKGNMAEITVEGTVVRTIDLSQVTQEETFVVDGPNGTNTVEVAPGQIRVLAADCPDQVCVHQGWISDGTAPIVCLPNQLVITIRGGDSSDVDGIAR